VLTVAYLANQFPSPVEPYVGEEIAELRRRGIGVITGSVRSPGEAEMADVVLKRAAAGLLMPGLWLCVTGSKRIAPLLARIVLSGRESPWQRLKALVHTWLGACYAVRLRDCAVDHIHVHHGYFASWIAMTAARLLDAEFSVTLHGSDLLLNGSYLDVKLAHCKFCLTISEYNRNYILKKFPHVDPQKIIVARLGVEVVERKVLETSANKCDSLNLLAVGRLHAVKDHAFLLRACAQLRVQRLEFSCRIVGEGPERRTLQRLILQSGLQNQVTLLGHRARKYLDPLYDAADAVVLTSRSEGIPLVLMEAMARGKIVVAPAITGIPELVIPGLTGFLYQPGSVSDFVAHLQLVDCLKRSSRLCHQPDTPCDGSEAPSFLERMQRDAIEQIRRNFDRARNLEKFGDVFIQRASSSHKSRPDANLILQQI